LVCAYDLVAMPLPPASAGVASPAIPIEADAPTTNATEATNLLGFTILLLVVESFCSCECPSRQLVVWDDAGQTVLANVI
jgi:hypothetical protein